MPTKRHHYVSQFYLEAFADPDSEDEAPFLWVFERGVEEPKPLAPKNVAVQTHYYSVRTAEGEKSDAMEQFLGAIEGAAAPVLRQISENDVSLSRVEREKLALFMVTAMLRVPRAREWSEKLAHDVVQLRARTMASAPGALESALAEVEVRSGVKSKVTAERLREFMLSDGYTLKINPVVSLQSLVELTPQLLPILFYMRWTILKAEGDDVFLTSDNPFVYVDPTHARGFWGVGLLNLGIELTFPISPQRCLVGTHDPQLVASVEEASPAEAGRVFQHYAPKMTYQSAHPLNVREINRRTVAHAKRYVFSSTNLPTIRRFVAKHLPAPAPELTTTLPRPDR